MEVDSTCVGLSDLPVEVLLHVLQYLEVSFLTQVLAKVSTVFRDIVEDSSTWKTRIQRRWPGQYPAIPPSNSFNWSQACSEREEEWSLWSGGGKGMVKYSNGTSHYSSVDAVHVMDSLVATGSRDRGINLWPFRSPTGEGKPLAKYPDSHKGWVWTLCSRDNLLVSGAWDNKIKFWQVKPDGMTEARKEIKLKTAVLASHIHENRVVAGTFDKKIIQMDTREEVAKMTFYKCHTKPVLAVNITEKHVFSLSEDKTLCVYDRVAGKRLKKVDIPGEGFPLSLSLLNNMLYVGDRAGVLHLIDTTAESFSLVQSFNTGSKGKITGIHSGLGSLITSSTDGTVSIYEPGRNLNLISRLQLESSGEIAQISYRHGVLAAAGSNNSVTIWAKPSTVTGC